MKRFNLALTGVAALSLLAPASVRAAFFSIDDTLPTDIIRMTANDFEGGLSIQGVLFQQGTNNPAVGDFPEGNAAGQPIVYSFQGSWITTGVPLPPPVQVAFLEPGTQILSDVLLCQYTNLGNGFGQINGHFVSDTGEQGLDPAQYITPGIPVTNWPENLGAFNFSAPFLTALANSDVDVPEPASCALVTVALGVLTRRRRR
jgi:hypothetical protein